MEATDIVVELARHSERIRELEESEESTRKKFDAAAGEQRTMAASLESIRFDVHAIREGKKSIMRMARAALFILGITGAGLVAGVRWAAIHWLHDLQVINETSLHERIEK